MQVNPLAALDLPLKAASRLTRIRPNVFYPSPPELASRRELSAKLARSLGDIETVTDAVLNRT